MVTMICEKTGVSFEAPNRRSKVHPTISAMLQSQFERNDAGYSAMQKELLACRQQGVTDIATFIERATTAADEAVHGAAEARRKAAERKERYAEARRQREIQNNKLRRNGYRWKRFAASTEEALDAFSPNAYEEVGSSVATYTLYAPDGRVVTVEEALAEIGE